MWTAAHYVCIHINYALQNTTVYRILRTAYSLQQKRQTETYNKHSTHRRQWTFELLEVVKLRQLYSSCLVHVRRFIMDNLYSTSLGINLNSSQWERDNDVTFHLQPLPSIHLHTHLRLKNEIRENEALCWVSNRAGGLISCLWCTSQCTACDSPNWLWLSLRI